MVRGCCHPLTPDDWTLRYSPAQKPSLLAGRIQIRLPKAARVESRRASIMAAKDAGEDETRAVLDVGTKRLVLIVYEMYTLSNGNLEQEIDRFYSDLEIAGKREAITLEAEGVEAVGF